MCCAAAWIASISEAGVEVEARPGVRKGRELVRSSLSGNNVFIETFVLVLKQIRGGLGFLTNFFFFLQESSSGYVPMVKTACLRECNSVA